ncbi:MAG: DUF3429 domain-containing protein [Proteobacteria bacterium]|jgi:hypothetical protein|nr:DUF3429 domain-containing protein [Pseudomonadota bacterium]
MSARASPQGAPLPALLLGAGGLLPFVGLTLLGAYEPEWSGPLLAALASYAAVILSFVGALHWGYAVQAKSAGRLAFVQYGWSVLPALVGWLALQLPLGTTLRVHSLAFVVCYAVDHGLAAVEDVPRWFLRLRAVLSAVAAAMLLGASWI